MGHIIFLVACLYCIIHRGSKIYLPRLWLVFKMLMVTADIAALCNYNSKCSSGFVKSFMIIEGSINVNDYVEEKTQPGNSAKKEVWGVKLTFHRWSNGNVQDYANKASGAESRTACSCGNRVGRKKPPSFSSITLPPLKITILSFHAAYFFYRFVVIRMTVFSEGMCIHRCCGG